MMGGKMKNRKNILITGVSSGLGLALAELCLGQNHSVYGLSRRIPEKLMDNPGFHFDPVDLSDLAAIPHAVHQLIENAAQLDLVVLNAGMLGEFGDMARVSLSIMKEVMDVNLWANKVLLDTLFDASVFVDQVIGISSGASRSGARGWNSYSISKAALNMLMLLYSQEFPETHFCALAPGVIETQMQDYLGALPSEDQYPILDILRSKRNTPQMLKPALAAEAILGYTDHLKTKIKSGSYVDIREMVQPNGE